MRRTCTKGPVGNRDEEADFGAPMLLRPLPAAQSRRALIGAYGCSVAISAGRCRSVTRMSGTAGATSFLDDFALKCFAPQSAAGTYIDCDKAEFVRVVQEHHDRVPPSTSLRSISQSVQPVPCLVRCGEARRYCPTCAAGDRVRGRSASVPILALPVSRLSCALRRARRLCARAMRPSAATSSCPTSAARSAAPWRSPTATGTCCAPAMPRGDQRSWLCLPGAASAVT